MIENVSEAIIHAFSKTKKDDENIIKVKEEVNNLETNISQLEKFANKLSKRNTGKENSR